MFGKNLEKKLDEVLAKLGRIETLLEDLRDHPGSDDAKLREGLANIWSYHGPKGGGDA